MSNSVSFEQLVVRREAGHVCQEESMVNLSLAGSYDLGVFKIITKFETSLLLLTSHSMIDEFTIDVVVRDEPKKRQEGALNFLRQRLVGGASEPVGGVEVMGAAWEKCRAKGYHGLYALSKVDSSCIPDNGSRGRYSVAQYVNALIHSVEAYFMFQKPNPLFVQNAVSLWATLDHLDMGSCYVVLAWKLTENPNTLIMRGSDEATRLPLSPLNTTSPPSDMQEEAASPTRSLPSALKRQAQKRDAKAQHIGDSETTPARKKPRLNLVEACSSADREEEDNEVTFKARQDMIPRVVYSPDITPTKTRPPTTPTTPKGRASTTPSTTPSRPEPAEYVTDNTSPQRPVLKNARKSVGRKSLVPGWPEEQKEDIMEFFDTLNPSQTEQTNIALTCKFATMKYDRELTSKQLYQWVQKKGRHVYPPLTNYSLPEGEKEAQVIQFFKALNPDISETKRVAFTCKFMQTQYGVLMQSKQFYNILNAKGKKAGKRR